MRLRGWLALVALLWCLPGWAADYYIKITNNTGYEIYYVYVSPQSSDEWEEDVLGADILADGETLRVNLNGYDSPYFDVKLVDEDGDSYTFMGVNVARRDLTVTLDDLDWGY